MATFAIAGAAAFALFVVVWVGSVVQHDASLVDRFWGLSFVLIAIVALLRSPLTPVAILTASAVGLWGLRLSIYLTLRNWGHGEDRRYGAMRAKIGPRFWWVSLASVFTVQAVLASIISLPVQSAIGGAHSFGVLERIGVALFAVGFTFEAVADAQLARFLRTSDANGRVMDRGLWSLSRHPNYFGEALLWWGLGLLGLRGALGAWSLLGSALITFMLLRVSGVTMLEHSIGERRPGYAEYARRTSTFVPWPPRDADR